MAHDRVLHPPRSERVVVGAVADGAPRRSDIVAYTLVQDTKKGLRKSQSFLCQQLSRLNLSLHRAGVDAEIDLAGGL